MDKSICPCVICRGKASLLRNSEPKGGTFWACPYCGLYGIQHCIYSGITEEKRMQVAAFLYHRNISGYPPLVLIDESELPQASIDKERDWSYYGIAEVYRRFPTNALTVLDASLINLSLKSKKSFHPFATIRLEKEQDFACFYSYNLQIFMSILALLTNNGFISCVGADFNIIRDNGELVGKFSKPIDIVILPKGWQQISELLKKPAGDCNQAFVAMKFHKNTDDIYKNGIKPAIESAHKPIDVSSVRIDEKEHANKICDEIIAEIRRSKYMVADFTGNRAGVYYEAGFAVGLNLPVIWTVHENSVGKLHFDTRQYNHIVYKTPEELREKLMQRIRAIIPAELIAMQ